MSRKDNLKVTILVGLPASGKSTYCKEIQEQNQNVVVVSRDSFRFMLRNQPFCNGNIEDLISDLVDITITKSLLKNKNIIIDNTNLKAKYINHFINLVKYDADVEFKIFDVDHKICIERDLNRDKAPVGKEVILRMSNDYNNLIKTFDFSSRIKLNKREYIDVDFHTNLPNAIIYDIDGNIALTGNRNIYDLSKVDLDIENKIVTETIQFHRSKNREIILMSGRDASSRELTIKWLIDNNIYFDLLFMREQGDNRKDSIIKKELYNKHVKDYYNVLAVYDDRLSVIKDCWNELGLFVFCTNQGLIEF